MPSTLAAAICSRSYSYVYLPKELGTNGSGMARGERKLTIMRTDYR